MQTILLDGNDISQYVNSIPPIVKNAGTYGQLIINDIQEFKGINTKRFWDLAAEESPFYNAKSLDVFAIEIIVDGVTTFAGKILNIDSDSTTKVATISLRSDLQTALEKGIVYVSTPADTPSNIVKDICNLYGIATDDRSFSRSNTEYLANSVQVSAFFRGETKLLGAFEQIAELGIARIYNVNQKIYFDVYREKTNDPVITFSSESAGEVNLYTMVGNKLLEKDQIQGYSIEWIGGAGGSLVTLGDETQRGITITAGYDNPVRIMTLQTAVWIGRKWFAYLNKVQKKISIRVPENVGKSLSIDDTVLVRYRDYSDTIIDIMSIDNSSLLFSFLVGLTR